MPQLTWTLDVDDRAALASLQAIQQAADQARSAVKGVGSAGTGSGGGGVAGGVNTSQIAQSQAALTRLGTQVDTLQRQLQRLGDTHPTIAAQTNFTALQRDAAALSTRLTALFQQPYSADVRISTTEARADLAQLQRDLGNLRGTASSIAPAVEPAEKALQSLGKTSEQAGTQVHGFGERVGSILQGLLIYRAISEVESGISHLVQSIVGLPAQLEQTQIAFTALLNGNTQAADDLLTKLQQLANVTPFHFEGEAAAARILLGLGQTAQNVLPELVDIDTAVAAVGGNDDTVNKVADALGRMGSEGRVNARDMKSLTDNGIPAWNILAEAMGKSVSQVRALSESGDIAAGTFEKAFHEYVVTHWGDAVAKQSQTFTGLVSTAQDLGETFAKVFGMPIIQELEPKLQGAVAALSDPRVVATLNQWGQAAATFVGWIFQAVGGVAQLLGLPTPDLSKSLADASATVKQFSGEWSAAQGPIDDTKKQTAEINRQIRQLELNLREANRASADTELSYKHQSDEISRQITLLDAKYEAENRAADIAGLRAKIAKDESLALDPYSSQGQAAAKRLVDERAQLAAKLREDQHANDKAALTDQKAGIDAREQTYRENAEQHAQTVQQQIDDLRQKALDLQNASATASTGGGGGLGPAVDTSGIKAASDEYRAFYDASTQQGQSWSSTVQAAIDGVIGKLRELGGAPGAVIGAVLDDWTLLTDTWDSIQVHANSILSAVDQLVAALGGRDGLQGVFIATGFEFQRLMESLAAVTPVILGRIGNEFGELGDAITEIITNFTVAVAWIKLQTGQGTQADLDKAQQAAANAAQAAARNHAAFVATDQQSAGTYQARIAAINKDIDARQAAAFAAADGQRARAQGAAYQGPVKPGYGLAGPSTELPIQGPNRPSDMNVHVTVGVDKNGIMNATAQAITGKRLLKNLGDAAGGR